MDEWTDEDVTCLSATHLFARVPPFRRSVDEGVPLSWTSFSQDEALLSLGGSYRRLES